MGLLTITGNRPQTSGSRSLSVTRLATPARRDGKVINRVTRVIMLHRGQAVVFEEGERGLLRWGRGRAARGCL